MSDEIKIRFTTKTNYTGTKTGYGHYLVPVSKIPDFLSKLANNETVYTSEVA
jgi:hypothetical protein